MEAILDINYFEYYNLVRKSELINNVLETIAKFEDEDLYLSGGVLRNAVWNKLHFRQDFLHTDDCDILYHSPINDKSYEKKIESFLYSINPNYKWSVKNQARMHIRNGHSPYENMTKALECFPETASAIAINGNWNIIAPLGFQDILNLVLKPTPFCINNELEVFKRRLELKKWLTKFEKLKAMQQNTTVCLYEDKVLM